MMIETYTKNCIRCGKEYTAKHHTAKYCEACKLPAKYELIRGYKQRAKEQAKQQERQKRKAKKSSLSEITRQIAEYNREHNTNISYGEYVAMKGV